MATPASPYEAPFDTTIASEKPLAEPHFDAEDSRSETSTVDTRSDNDDAVAVNATSLTFFKRISQLPVINDALSKITDVAGSNRYTKVLVGYSAKIGFYAEKSRPLFKPVVKPLAVLDEYANRSLDYIEAKYPIMALPTNEVIESVQSQAKAVEEKYPIIADSVIFVRNTTNSALDHVDGFVDYVLPCVDTDSQDKRENDTNEVVADSIQATNQVNTPLEKANILIHKIPRRLYIHYHALIEYNRDRANKVRRLVKDKVYMYEDEVKVFSNSMYNSVQSRVKTTISVLPQYIPEFAKPYYEKSKDLVATKTSKLQNEYSRKDEDARIKVLNIILIIGEDIPVLENITARVFGKAILDESNN